MVHSQLMEITSLYNVEMTGVGGTGVSHMAVICHLHGQ